MPPLIHPSLEGRLKLLSQTRLVVVRSLVTCKDDLAQFELCSGRMGRMTRTKSVEVELNGAGRGI